MKTVIALALLIGSVSAHAGTCDLISGSFKTTTTECKYSHDGVTFYPEGYKDINLAYKEQGEALTVVMNVSSGPYTLNFVADGKPQTGRPMFEGEKYTAQCENNHIHTRSEMSALKYPLIHDFTATPDGKMTYQESFEGDKFVRICEMERI